MILTSKSLMCAPIADRIHVNAKDALTADVIRANAIICRLPKRSITTL